MVLENVKEIWTEKPKGGKGKGVNKDRFISKMCVCSTFNHHLVLGLMLINLLGSCAATPSFSSCSADRVPCA